MCDCDFNRGLFLKVIMVLKLFLFLISSGFLAGIFSSAAGLASLVSYPALLMVGLPPVMANVTNTYSLLASGFSSILASKQELRGRSRQLMRIMPLSVIGVIIGALLLFWIPAEAFKKVVPFFIMFAGIMVLVPNQKKDDPSKKEHLGFVKKLMAYFGIFLEGIYTGYFGAGGGVVFLALMIMINRQDSFAVNNAIKNFTLAFANVVGAFVYFLKASILWKYVIPLAIGLWFGGMMGPKIVRIIPEKKMRWISCILSWILGISLLVQTYHLI